MNGKISPIAYMRTDFPQKFGIPRQSGLVEALKGRIEFLPEYSDISAFRGLEEFSHLWVIWEFSQSVTQKFQPTVRPPRLGGNKRMGVFATRSPFRPNSIGLSCVKIQSIYKNESNQTVIAVTGCDMLDNTPVYDIKPYLPFTDSIPDAVFGFAENTMGSRLEVMFDCQCDMPEDIKESLKQILSDDPRPSYQDDENRVYGFCYAGYEIRFTVKSDTLHVSEIEKNTKTEDK